MFGQSLCRAVDRTWATILISLTSDQRARAPVPTDGYKGLMGTGPKGAHAILRDFWVGEDFWFPEAWEAVVAAYKAKGQTNYLEQAQMARILREGDYDSLNRAIRLFNPDEEQWLYLPDV